MKTFIEKLVNIYYFLQQASIKIEKNSILLKQLAEEFNISIQLLFTEINSITDKTRLTYDIVI